MSKRRPSQVRQLVRQAALKTTGEVLPRGGSPTQPIPTRTQVERAAKNGISVRTQGKLDFLGKAHPDLLEQVKRGSISVDRAYKQARGIKKPSPLERVIQIWEPAQSHDRLEIARWVTTAHHEDIHRQLADDSR